MTYSSMWIDLLGVPFAQRWVDAGGIRTRYLETGSASQPALIFLHGTGGHAEAYCRNIGPHGRHFHTFSVDMIGHGFTDKPDIPLEIPRYVDHLVRFMDDTPAHQRSTWADDLPADVLRELGDLLPDGDDDAIWQAARLAALDAVTGASS